MAKRRGGRLVRNRSRIADTSGRAPGGNHSAAAWPEASNWTVPALKALDATAATSAGKWQT